MAKIHNQDNSLKSGKMNKKDKEVHRVINGKEYVHTVNNEYAGPASEAQTVHRTNFAKINSIVNRIMADPAQVTDFEQRMEAENKKFSTKGLPKPFGTPRQYVYAVIRDQIALTPPPPTQLPKGISLHIRTFADLSTSELYEILKARYAVFTKEQGIIYLDEDDIDYLATHVFLTRGPKVIAYARLFREKTETNFDPDKYELVSNDSIFCIGRMLTTERHQGFGSRLMHTLLAESRRQGARTLRLHAQLPAVPFYERFGFHSVGDIFEEAKIPHILMEMSL
jgi:ElaA protein